MIELQNVNVVAISLNTFNFTLLTFDLMSSLCVSSNKAFHRWAYLFQVWKLSVSSLNEVMIFMMLLINCFDFNDGN